MTSFTRDARGVRRTLLDEQCAAAGLPLAQVFITPNASNDEYESKIGAALDRFQAEGVTSVVFGDIFLEDLHKYRERIIARIGMKAVFPLWKQDTEESAHASFSYPFEWRF